MTLTDISQIDLNSRKHFMQLFYDRNKKQEWLPYQKVNLKELRFSDEVYNACIQRHQYIINVIPLNSLSSELCRKFVSVFGNLHQIPEQFKTREVLLEAVKRHGQYLDSINPSLIDEEMALLAINSNFYSFACDTFYVRVMKYIPDQLKTTPFFTKIIYQKIESIRRLELNQINSGIIF